jgi:hypothetical protein
MDTESLTPPPASGRDEQLDQLASQRMKSGIALLSGGQPQDIPEAIRFFEEAIELRKQLPLAENPGFRYSLSAGWINRGDALGHMGTPENLVEAVKSYAEAIELLKEPPADDNGLFARRLAIARLNCGIALEKQASEATRAEAIESYRESIRLLSPRNGNGGGAPDPVLTSAWINLGNAVLQKGGGASAREACETIEEVLALLAESETKELHAAEAGLKARHVLCQAMAYLLGDPSQSPDPDLIDRITDTVEEALGLAKTWEKTGVTAFQEIATQFFHLGALVYEKYQTHFLAEYLTDHLEPPVSAAWLQIAQESLTRVRNALRSRDFSQLATPQGLRQLEILKEVQAAEERVQMLRA